MAKEFLTIWHGPDAMGYHSSVTWRGTTLNVRRAQLGWCAYVDGDALPLAYPTRTSAQRAAEDEAERLDAREAAR